MTFRNRQRPRIARVVGASAAALLAVGIAACTSSGSGSASSGSSASSTSSTGVGLAGQFGSVPAQATGTEKAGTITVAGPPNSAPTWILPIIPGASYSVFTAYEFDEQMYRPLYWLVNGMAPKETPAMSLANEPDLVQRRQDGHVHAQVQLQVVRRQADHLPGRRCSGSTC